MRKGGKLIGLLLVMLCATMMVACGEQDTSKIEKSEIGDLYSNPDDYAGRTFDFTAQVFDVEKDSDGIYFQCYYDIENYDKNTVVYTEDTDLNLKEDDFVRVEGSVDGEFSGENAFGGEVTAPQVKATKVKKISAMEAFPAVKTVKVDKTITKGNYKATVKKVDYTDSEMRIYLKVTNNSSSDFDNYPDQGSVIQKGKQHEVEYNDYYPQPSSELKAGASSESVIVFKNVKKSDFRYEFSGYNDDYDEVNFSFDIKVK